MIIVRLAILKSTVVPTPGDWFLMANFVRSGAALQQVGVDARDKLDPRNHLADEVPVVRQEEIHPGLRGASQVDRIGR